MNRAAGERLPPGRPDPKITQVSQIPETARTDEQAVVAPNFKRRAKNLRLAG